MSLRAFMGAILGVALSLLFEAQAMPAQAATITFNGTTAGAGTSFTTLAVGNTYTEAGYRVTALTGAVAVFFINVAGSSVPSSFDGDLLSFNSLTDSVSITADNGSAFDANSLRFGASSTSGTDGSQALLTGTLAAGGMLTQQLTAANFTSNIITLSGFTGLSSLVITTNNIFPLFDDINLTESVAAIPIPAAFPLFGTGLGLLGFLGWRRRKVAAAV